MKKQAQLTTIDLFSGAGGLSEGFRMQGFKTLFANDFEKSALATFKQNHPDTICSTECVKTLQPSEIRLALGLKKGELTVLTGGPPCQGFSTYGKRDINDDRNRLYLEYIRFLEEFRPEFFVIENVAGILSMLDGKVVEDIQEKTFQLGYTSSIFILDACEFGVPQYRKRVFIIGAKDNLPIEDPLATHGTEKTLQQSLFSSKNLLKIVTVKDAISDLPVTTLRPKDTKLAIPYESVANTAFQKWARNQSTAIFHHSSKQMLGIRHLRLALMHPGDYGTKLEERLEKGGLPEEMVLNLMYGESNRRDINECRMEDREKEQKLISILKEGKRSIQDIIELIDSGGFANKYRRLQWEKPSHTLVAHMARDCSDFVHPSIDRFLSVREAARLQSFPDKYIFSGSQFSQFKQIGNAVPPLLGKAVAATIIKMIGAPK